MDIYEMMRNLYSIESNPIFDKLYSFYVNQWADRPRQTEEALSGYNALCDIISKHIQRSEDQSVVEAAAMDTATAYEESGFIAGCKLMAGLLSGGSITKDNSLGQS